jgi:hypothetical protein
MLKRERHRVYAVLGAPPSEFRPLKAAELAGWPNMAASHFGAGWLHRSPHLVMGRVELTSFGSTHRRLKGVQIHQSEFLVASDLQTVRNTLVTTPARTLFDLAAGLNPYLLAKVFQDFDRRGLLDLSEMVEMDARLGGRGRAGTRLMRRLIERAVEILPGDSDLEVRIMEQLIALGVTPPVQQFQVIVGGRVYIIDLAWPWVKVGLEVDGFESRATREALEHDTERTNALQAAGWEIYHATARSDIDALAPTLHRAISRG